MGKDISLIRNWKRKRGSVVLAVPILTWKCKRIIKYEWKLKAPTEIQKKSTVHLRTAFELTEKVLNRLFASKTLQRVSNSCSKRIFKINLWALFCTKTISLKIMRIFQFPLNLKFYLKLQNKKALLGGGRQINPCLFSAGIQVSPLWQGRKEQGSGWAAITRLNRIKINFSCLSLVKQASDRKGSCFKWGKLSKKNSFMSMFALGSANQVKCSMTNHSEILTSYRPPHFIIRHSPTVCFTLVSSSGG